MSSKGFIKTASVSTIAVAISDGKIFQKSAAYKDEQGSAYLSGSRTIDIKAALDIVASEYNISPNPEDYVFEAIRGNTANIPNENHDAFHKNELLRFDHRLGKQVYRTYELKPHHVQHRASDPKAARGFIVDAHYNDSAGPLDECPNCGHKTASKEGRDQSGIHCASCGSVVKDEYVELLIAIDKTKDPTFAQGVMSGVLKHGSMGCSCLRTRCNVCGKVAYTRSEFCGHIARGKGKEYDESEPGFNPIAFVVKGSKDKRASKPKKIAKSFEWCEGVIYDEFSRVHDPADPKAEQYEILKLTAKVAELEHTDKLRNESEILTLQARVAELERKLGEKLNKIAQVVPPVDPMMAPPVDPMMAPPVDPAAAPSSVLPSSAAGQPPVVININAPGVGVDSEQPLEEVPAPPKIPIEEMTPESEGMTPAGPGEALTPAAMGIEEEKEAPAAPKRGASVDRALREMINNLGGPSMLRFAQSYKHIKAEITSAGNVRIFDSEGTLFVVKPDRLDSNIKIAAKNPEELAKSVLTMVADFGIGGAIKRTNAIVGPRLAQVLEYATDDIEDEDRIKTDSIKDKEDSDMTQERAKPEDSATEAGESADRQETQEVKGLGDNVLVDREVDVEDEKHTREPGKDQWGGFNILEMQDADTKEKREKKDVGKDTVVKNIQTDHKEKVAEKTESKKYDNQVHAARLEGIYKARLERKIADLTKEKEDFKNNLVARVTRAMKLVAHRQALNLEYSPLKLAMGVALCNKRALNDKEFYNPMDQGTAVQLIEAAFSEPIIEGVDKAAWEHHIDSLIERAASVMQMNDEALMQVETDLRNIKTATIPFDEAVVNTDGDFELKQAAKQGNLQLAPKPVDDAPAINNKREAIRRAVGTTKVASLAR